MHECPYCASTVRAWLSEGVLTFQGGCGHLAGFRLPALPVPIFDANGPKPGGSYGMY